MAIVDGWLTWAERIPGPPDKKYSQPNSCQGYIPHSAVGYYPGWAGRLFSTQRNPDGSYTDYAAASVHLWVPYGPRQGRPLIIQHYPFYVSCWASGNSVANTSRVAAETEGGYDPHSESLTAFQIDMHARIIDELSRWKGWEPKRPSGVMIPATLMEHRESVALWGGGVTACPSNRFSTRPWANDGAWTKIFARLESNVALTPVQQESVSRSVVLTDILGLVQRAIAEGKEPVLNAFQKEVLKQILADW